METLLLQNSQQEKWGEENIAHIRMFSLLLSKYELQQPRALFDSTLAHFSEEEKNSLEKVESHLHNCFYDVAGVPAPCEEECGEEDCGGNFSHFL